MNKCGNCDKFAIQEYVNRITISICLLDGLARCGLNDCCDHWQEKEVKYTLDDCERLVRVND